jgi:hypothetical protein
VQETSEAIRSPTLNIEIDGFHCNIILHTYQNCFGEFSLRLQLGKISWNSPTIPTTTKQ